VPECVAIACGRAQIMRTGWYRAVHVKSFDANRARALLGARLQPAGMVTRLSNHIRGVLKTFGMLPGSVRGRSFAELSHWSRSWATINSAGPDTWWCAQNLAEMVDAAALRSRESVDPTRSE